MKACIGAFVDDVMRVGYGITQIQGADRAEEGGKLVMLMFVLCCVVWKPAYLTASVCER